MVNSKSRLLDIFAVLLISSVLLVAALSASGLLDPKPTGTMVWQQEPTSLHIDVLSTEVMWLTDASVRPIVSTRLTSRHNSGETDVGFGLSLDHGEEIITIALSPLGYAAIWRQKSAADLQPTKYYMPWQTWPHVQTGNQENEILATVEGESLIVRVNRELLWEGAISGNINRVGLFGASFGDEAVIDVQSVELFAD